MSYEASANVTRSRFHSEVVADVTGVSPSVTSATVSVDGTADTINDAVADLSIFRVGQTVIITGFTESANNAVYTLSAVGEDQLSVIEDTLVTEALGDTVTIASALAVQYDNDGSFVKPDNQKWVRVTILPGVSQLSEFGATKTTRHPGVMIAQIFVPGEGGDKTALELADKIVAAFRAVRDTSGSVDVVFRTPYITVVGMNADTSEWQVNVNCPYYFDEVS